MPFTFILSFCPPHSHKHHGFTTKISELFYYHQSLTVHVPIFSFSFPPLFFNTITLVLLRLHFTFHWLQYFFVLSSPHSKQLMVKDLVAKLSAGDKPSIRKNVQSLPLLRCLPLFLYQCTYYCDFMIYFDCGIKVRMVEGIKRYSFEIFSRICLIKKKC